MIFSLTFSLITTFASIMNLAMLQDLENKKKKIGVVGLGYVGLPLALEFASRYGVIGFDINEERISMMQNDRDPSMELPESAFQQKDIVFTADPEDLKQAHFFIIAVPTPLDEHKVPDLGPLISASKIVGSALKAGDYVVYESTVYPGCTEEDCLPHLMAKSGLKLSDFNLGYSPERISPGDTQRTLRKITKIVSGHNEASLEVIANLYDSILEAGVFKATSIKVAEAAKVIENTQRDLNISLMNELSIIFDKMNIKTKDVLDAAGTKWNFLRFSPGLVGGHCISIDPYYLTHKATQLGYTARVIKSGRTVNDYMSRHIAKKILQKLIKAKKNIVESRVLIMGITFKENVSDIRNSKVSDLVRELQDYSISVDVSDPHADEIELKKEYGINLISEMNPPYDCVVVAVGHEEYLSLDIDYFKSISAGKGILIDIKGLYPETDEMDYWSL